MSQTSRLHIDNPGESIITRTISLGLPFSQSYLRCSRDGCSESFSASQVDKWGAHNQVCISTPHLRCSFTSCKAKLRTGTRQDLTDHENTTHSIWICIHCEQGFKTWRLTVAHVLNSHNDSASENSIRRLWISHFDLFTKDPALCVDLHNPAAQQQQQQQTRPFLPTLNESLIRYLNANTAALLSFLEDQKFSQPGCLIPLHINSFLSNIGTGQVTAPSTNYVATASQQQLEPLTIPQPASIPAANFPRIHRLPGRSPTRTKTLPVPTREGTWPDFDPPFPAYPNIRPDTEPFLPISIPLSDQLRYFGQIQSLIIGSSFKFYMRHKIQLDSIRDRNQVPLCRKPGHAQGHHITENPNHYHSSGGFIPITKADDLTLPQWTHLLRRLQDAKPKGLTKDMVSRLESFNGEIMPVDEVRHAFTKEKIKSDRDLLALIQTARTFCWQLMDWGSCRDLDELYKVVEQSCGLEKPPRSPTWPLAG